MSLFSSAFRAIIGFQIDVQSHHHHFSVSAFRAIIGFQIDIQSRILGFGVQSRYHCFQFGVQSHHYRFSVSAFIAIIAPQFDIQSRILVRRSEPLLLLSLTFRVVFSFVVQRHYVISSGVQSYVSLRSVFRAMFRFILCSEPSSHLCSAFRATTHQYQCSELSSSYFQFRCSEPSLISISVQSHFIIHSNVRGHALLRLAFRAIITIFSVAFRAIIASQFWHS